MPSDLQAGVAILTRLHDLQAGEDGALGPQQVDYLEGPAFGTDDDTPVYVNDDLTVAQAIDAYIREQVAGLSETTKALQLGVDGVVGDQPGADGIIDIGDLPGDDGLFGTPDDVLTGADDVPSDDLTLDEAIDAYLLANPGAFDYLKTSNCSPSWAAASTSTATATSTFATSCSPATPFDDVVVGNSMLATIHSSTVDTAGEVTVTASNYDVVADDSSGITAIGIALGIAAGGAGGVSVNVSGAGVIAFNEVSSGIEASIVNSTVTAGGDVTVEAIDKAEIDSLLLAISVSAGGAGAVSVNVAASFTYADNTMGGSLLATIDSSDVETTGGEITVDAYADNQVRAIGVAVGVAAGGAGGASINVSIAGVGATNTTTNSVEASIRNGSNVGDGDTVNVFECHQRRGSPSVRRTCPTSSAILVSAAVSAGGAGAAVGKCLHCRRLRQQQHRRVRWRRPSTARRSTRPARSP